MKAKVYLETTVIGYLAMRPSGLLRVVASQQTTHEWWKLYRKNYDLFVSRFVLDECLRGDADAARERLVFLQSVPVLGVTADVEELADAIATAIQLPTKARLDAFHISIAAVHGVEYLLTWNCKHIANPELHTTIESTCRDFGFEPPVICTPHELLEAQDDDA